MNLAKKTFLYSILLAVLMVSMVAGYFTWMLPSLYVDYMKKNNLDSVISIEKGYMKTGSYKELAVKNPTATFTLEIPDTGETIYAAGKFFKVSITVKDSELMELLDSFRLYAADFKAWQDMETDFDHAFFIKMAETLKKKQLLEGMLPDDYPLDIRLEEEFANKTYQQVFGQESVKVHFSSDDIIVCESSVSDGNTSYTTYVAIGKTNDSIVISFLPAMTPEMKELLPIISGSLPMIIAVVFLLVLIFSQIFSGNIITPLIRLAGYAETLCLSEQFVIDPFKAEGNDEIGALGRTLNALYKSLQEKNRSLAEENERKEVFLRSSSHQLKTPITATLLLVDGMIDQVGIYKNTEECLPRVKEQLLSMKTLVEDILYLNHCADNLQIETVSLGELAQEAVSACQIQAADKRLDITITGSGTGATDREIMKIMLDNLLSNAISYTPERERIEVTIQANRICIRNYGVTIEENLLPRIFEPFVSSDTNQKCKGLGLYLVSYYSRLLGGSVVVENIKNSVQAELTCGMAGNPPQQSIPHHTERKDN